MNESQHRFYATQGARVQVGLYSVSSSLGQVAGAFLEHHNSFIFMMKRTRKAEEHASTLIVWDFDWSLVNENSDTFALKRIGIETTDNFFIFKQKLDGALNIMSLKDTKFFQELKRIVFKQ